jgi:hypothetical protein
MAAIARARKLRPTTSSAITTGSRVLVERAVVRALADVDLIGEQRAEQIERLVEVDVAHVGQPTRAPAVRHLLELGRRLAACGHDRVARQHRIGAIEIVDESHREPLAILVSRELEQEEPVRRRVDRRVVVLRRRLAERGVVDDRVALEDQRAQLGVEAAPHLAELLVAALDQRREPRPQRDDVELLLLPAVEIEAALDLLRGRELDQRLRVLEPDLVDQLVHLVG